MDGDRYGARTVFRIAILIFTIGSVLCGLSVSLATIVASRVVQGFGGAMMCRWAGLIVLRTIPKSELVSAMSYLTCLQCSVRSSARPSAVHRDLLSWRWISLSTCRSA